MGKRAGIDWEDRIRTYLARMAYVRRGGGLDGRSITPFSYEYSCFEDFHLRNGVFYQPFRHTGYRTREHGQCFQNAYSLLDENPRDLRYCEGFATRGFSPVYHCWNLDAVGRVVDSTWGWGDPNEDGNPKGYFGVCFPTKLVQEYIEHAPHYGLLDDPANKWPLLRTAYNPEELLSSMVGNRPERARNLKAYRKNWGY